MAKVVFKSLKIQNFLSYGNKVTKIDLDTGALTLIMGTNNDAGEEGYSKNGSGKSSALQALFWCLFGEGIGNIKQDDFINLKNKKRMVVELELLVDGSVYVITRGRKPNRVEMTKNGQPFTLSTAKNVDETICILLGMDSSVFLNTVLLTTNVESFMALKPAAQRDFMERLLSMDLLSQRATSVKTLRADTVAEIKGEEKSLEQIEKSNLRISDNINELEGKVKVWDSERASGTKELEDDLDELKAVDTDAVLKDLELLESWEKELIEVCRSVEKISSKADAQLAKVDRFNVELESLLSGKCPYCSQSYTNELKIEEVKESIEDINNELERLNSEFDPLLAKEAELKELIKDWKEVNPDSLTRAEISEVLNQIRLLEARIADMRRDTVNPYLDQLETLKNSLVAIDKANLYELQNIQTHCDVLVKLLTDSKSFVRKSIIDQYVPFLNKRINGYLDLLKLNHGIRINNDLTTDVEYLGDTISFGNLSNGEKLRVNLAINLAFRDLVEVSGTSCNLLVLDEFLDSGSDQSFFYSAMSLLGQMKDLSTFVVSHREEIKPLVDRIMTVTKENGFSTVTIEAV